MKNSYLTLLVSIICIGTSNAENSFPVPSGVVRINEKSGINRLLFQEIAEPNGEGLVSMITGQQRGLLIKDRTNSKGGLWLIGAGSTSTPISAGGIGAGLVGDMATYIALAPNTSAITFLDGRINFFANKGFSAGQRYWPTPKMILNADGNLGIGTVPNSNANSYKLAVAGSIGAWGEVRVFTNGSSFPDYVFDPSYKLRSLEETEKYVKENHHLPEVPSAAEIAKEGMSLNGMSKILLKKVEELTLHLIEMKKEVIEIKKENEELRGRLEKIEKHD
jgi:hypothetical protein